MRSEFIGKQITITDSPNKSLVGMKGKVIDETKNTVSVEMDGKTKIIVKDQCVFEINGKKIEGKTITKRPEERIKT